MIEEATTAVELAESTKTQKDVDSARVLVVALDDGPEKTSLEERLVSVENDIKDIEKLEEATSAVELAESTKLSKDINKARNLVNSLKESADKTKLSNRLDAVETEVKNAEELDLATTAVELAESTEEQKDLDEARGLVEALVESKERDSLLDRLTELNKKIKNKNRRKKTMRYGLKEVADVIFFDVSTKRPVLIFDTYINAI